MIIPNSITISQIGALVLPNLAKGAIFEHLLETTLLNYNRRKGFVCQLCNKSVEEFLWLVLWGVEQLYRGYKGLEATLRQACIMPCN